MLSAMMRLGEENTRALSAHGVAQRRCGALMESDEVGDESVVRGARMVAPRSPFAEGHSQVHARGRKSDARHEPRLDDAR
jgi:hypothetical protein